MKSLSALALNCTLKASSADEPSSTDKLLSDLLAAMEPCGVQGEIVTRACRARDRRTAPSGFAAALVDELSTASLRYSSPRSKTHRARAPSPRCHTWDAAKKSSTRSRTSAMQQQEGGIMKRWHARICYLDAHQVEQVWETDVEAEFC